MPKTMASAKKVNSVFGGGQGRRRLIGRPRSLMGAAVAMVVPIAVISQIFCSDFTAMSGASAAVFVTGLFVQPTRITTRTIISNCNLIKPQHRYPSEILQPSPSSSRRRRRESICLFGAKSFLDDEDSSTAVLSEAPRKTNTESFSLSGDGDDDDEQLLLMNPMEDFATDLGSETMDFNGDNEYKRGLLTIGFITFLFATNSPVLHWAFTSGDNPPPVLLVNAAVSIVALVGLLLGGDTLEDTGALPSDNSQTSSTSKENNDTGWTGGLELGIWKFLGTTSNLYGLALTTAGHGALLIQLTTLIVPTTRALVYKETISTKLKISIGLALSGVICFANDPTGTPSLLGDGLCVVAAICYSAYDLRLYEYGKTVDAVKPLITTKIATQAFFSISLLFLAPSSLLAGETITESSSWEESSDYLQALVASSEWFPVLAAVVWSGVAVNAIAPFLQVGGQQVVGPTKCQTIYASQPLWAAAMSFVFLGERLGPSGFVGGTAFLFALALAATADSATKTTATDSEKISSTAAATKQIAEPAMPERTKDTRSNATTKTIDFGADGSAHQ